MTTFFGDVDSLAIIRDHCHLTGHGFKFEPLVEDPREAYENKYADWNELNWNHIGHLNTGDKVAFHDGKGFCCIRILKG